MSTPRAQSSAAPDRRDYARGGLAGWQVRRIRAAAETRLAELTAARLAAEVGLSVFHFTRAFRESFGVSPGQWLIDQRIARSRKLLRESRRTVDDIALSVGYRSGSQLARIFRARTGLTPQALRRR
jgi:AraC family transcriptional regulator